MSRFTAGARKLLASGPPLVGFGALFMLAESQESCTAACAIHADLTAIGACARCGRFLCDGCLPRMDDAPEHECFECADLTSTRGLDDALRRVRRERSAVSAVLGAVVALTTTAVINDFLEGQGRGAWNVVLGWLFFAAPLWVSALVTARSGRVSALWATLVVEFFAVATWTAILPLPPIAEVVIAVGYVFYAAARTQRLRRLLRRKATLTASARARRPAVAVR